VREPEALKNFAGNPRSHDAPKTRKIQYFRAIHKTFFTAPVAPRLVQNLLKVTG
jgi:hypothetical protein